MLRGLIHPHIIIEGQEGHGIRRVGALSAGGEQDPAFDHRPVVVDFSRRGQRFSVLELVRADDAVRVDKDILCRGRIAGHETTRKSQPSGEITLPIANAIAVLRAPEGPFSIGMGQS